MSKKKRKSGCKECRHRLAAARAVCDRYDAMGFRHNPERAKGARAVLKAIGGHHGTETPTVIAHVAGLTPVSLSWSDE